MRVALVVTTLVALLTRPGRTVALTKRRLVAVVPALDGIRAVALVAIPVMAALVFVDHRSSEAETVAPAARSIAPVVKGAGLTLAEPDDAAVDLPNTGPDDSTTLVVALPSFAEGDTPVVCRNSTDSVCGPFRWDPTPSTNSPVDIAITYSPAEPRIGETVTVTVRVRDADARIGDVTVTYGDEDVSLIPPAAYLGCAEPAGPWTPPAPTPDEVVRTFQHAFTKAGNLSLSAYAASPELLNATCPPNPYASQGAASVPIHVGPG